MATKNAAPTPVTKLSVAVFMKKPPMDPNRNASVLCVSENEVIVLTRSVTDEDESTGWDEVCGVTKSLEVAETWNAGDGQSARLLPIGILNNEGWDALQFETKPTIPFSGAKAPDSLDK